MEHFVESLKYTLLDERMAVWLTIVAVIGLQWRSPRCIYWASEWVRTGESAT